MKIPIRSNKPEFGGDSYYHIYRFDQSRGPLLANEGYPTGGKDAQDIENSKAYYPDFKVANNDFKIVNGLVLEFWGRRNSPLFYRCFEVKRDYDTSGNYQLLHKKMHFQALSMTKK